MKNIVTLISGSLLLILCACHRQPTRVALDPPPAPLQIEIPATILQPPAHLPPLKWPTPAPPPELGVPPRPDPPVLRTAEEDFENARYVLAARGYETYLRDYPSRGHEDRILFLLGISYALVDNSPAGWKKARSRLERLVALYPNSPYKPQAKVILDLQSQVEQKLSELQIDEERIKQLTDELNKLKQIDMQRQPSRPHR